MSIHRLRRLLRCLGQSRKQGEKNNHGWTQIHTDKKKNTDYTGASHDTEHTEVNTEKFHFHFCVLRVTEGVLFVRGFFFTASSALHKVPVRAKHLWFCEAGLEIQIST